MSDPKKVEGAKPSPAPMLFESKDPKPEAPTAGGTKPPSNSPSFAPLSPPSATNKPADNTSSPLTPAPIPAPVPATGAPTPAAPVPAAPASRVKPPAEGTYFIPEEGKSTGAVPAPLAPPPLPNMKPPVSAMDAGRVKPIAASNPSAPARPTPRAEPKVVVYDEQEYTCQPNDSFEQISVKYYMSDKFAEALRRHNRQHARASDRMAHDGTIAVGEKIYIPQAYILEERYGDAIVKPTGAPSQTVPASFTPPASGSSLPAPTPSSSGAPPRS
ncbi:MAG TPA: hypothetical protein VN688_01800 [Gemmataceae bacterium]|nr:hypothetical protein [Gemmataceae bacterium]